MSAENRKAETTTLSSADIYAAMKRHLDKGSGFNWKDSNIFRAWEATENVVIHNIAERLGTSPLELTGAEIEKFLNDDQNEVVREQLRMLGVSPKGLTLSEAISVAKQAFFSWCNIALPYEQRKRMHRE